MKFKEFFESNGSLKQVSYHISNTDKEITNFIPSQHGIYGWGVYTTPNLEKIKKHFYDPKSKRHGGRIYKLEITINNPIDESGTMKDGANYWELINEVGPEQAKNYALSLGHNTVIRTSTDGTKIILPFEGRQIKILDSNFKV